MGKKGKKAKEECGPARGANLRASFLMQAAALSAAAGVPSLSAHYNCTATVLLRKMVLRASPHAKRLVCKNCRCSLVPGVSSTVRFSTLKQKNSLDRLKDSQDQLKDSPDQLKDSPDQLKDSPDQPKNSPEQKDRSERLVLHECKTCSAVRAFPVKRLKPLFHDTAKSSISLIE